MSATAMSRPRGPKLGRNTLPSFGAALEMHEMLIDGKDVLAKEIEASAKTEGFSTKQLRTAGEKIGVIKWKETGTLKGDWFWRLPKR